MGFYKEDYEIIESLLESGRLKKGFKVCEFGAQDLCEDRNGERILNANNRISPKGVYESYGAKEYCCIDLERYHNALNFDLGKDFKTEYGFDKKFDLVTCKDVGHWVFNQEIMWNNLHTLCKKGGVIIWRSPFGGGFAQGCYAYHHYKVLQLVFFNNYLLLGGYITEYLHDVTNGKFDNFDKKPAEKLKMRNGADFIDAVEEYMGREGCWRYLPLKQGLPSVSFELMFLKQEDTPFNLPLTYYDEPERTITRNAKSVAQNCCPKISKNKVAIFGAARAGGVANEFAKASGLNVACVIDDVQTGTANFCAGGGIIVSFDEFVKHYQSQCDFILVGPCQKGEIEGREGLKIPVFKLDMRWFVG